jgi:dTDP-4-dehydrorhamnose reductase
MKYAIIGSAGQVGQEFAKLLPGDSLFPLPHHDVDVNDAGAVERALAALDCDVVVNLAAFHNVNGCEEDAVKAFQVNAVGAYNVARAAVQRGCKPVYFSSDYVFGLDAYRRRPYVETDDVGPLNVYGASKVAGEHMVRATTDDHLIVRTSSLFGAVRSRKGWTFPEMMIERARAGQPLRVVKDQYMSPTYTFDLVRAVIALLEAGATGTIHVTSGDGCTWYEFAVATLELAGMDCPIEPVTSDAFPSKARRPSYSRLDSERFSGFGVASLRHWKDALKAYLQEKREAAN